MTAVTRIKSRSGEKVQVPWKLRKAIMNLQVNNNRSFDEACKIMADRFDSNSPEFERRVKQEVSKQRKSELMKSINKSRATIREAGWQEGMNDGMAQLRSGIELVRATKDYFKVACSTCGEPMQFSSNQSNWQEIRTALQGAFKNWSHLSHDS
ncbi:MAG: hypothetical protein V3U49_05330 [Nitrososphaerales archaeon]